MLALQVARSLLDTSSGLQASLPGHECHANRALLYSLGLAAKTGRFALAEAQDVLPIFSGTAFALESTFCRASVPAPALPEELFYDEDVALEPYGLLFDLGVFLCESAALYDSHAGPLKAFGVQIEAICVLCNGLLESSLVEGV